MKETIKQKQIRKVRRAHRTRSKIRGTQERPRLTVFRSSKHITAQVIDDSKGVVLAMASDSHVEAKGKKPLEIAALVGAEVAKRAKTAGITKIMFDRGAYLYHGRVKAIADSARENGLEF
ncbi:50S ribosomal protein L18 [Patescibacteria group bacterium]|nr:50S ribosomal protein L18 [Patescibacteria group bacterium]MBU4453051.1 50S ribosomal protein L18 [Patescibacteria group bacterium]MCG2687550.1 50S ribosomal protein L18 [Candidatus Parcubacteria bacterium]